MADSCARALRLEGCEARVALTLGDAPRLLSAYPPVAVLIDVRAPLSSSLDLAAQVRSLTSSAVVIAVVTSDRRPSTAVLTRANELGVVVRYTPLWLTERVALARSLLTGGPTAGAGGPGRAGQ